MTEGEDIKDKIAKNQKKEFSKILLRCDYIIFGVLIICHLIWGNLTEIIVAWAIQIGISSGFYYWKAKSENRTKIPIKIINSLPPEIRSELDLTDLIKTVIQME